MKKLLLFTAILTLNIQVFAQIDSTKKKLSKEEERAMIARELPYVIAINSAMSTDMKEIDEDGKNKWYKTIGHILMSFKERAIPTDTVGGIFTHKKHNYKWTLYYYFKGREPIFIIFKALHKGAKDIKEPTKDFGKEIILGNTIRDILRLNKIIDKQDVKQKLEAMFIDLLKKSYKTKNFEPCWFLPACD